MNKLLIASAVACALFAGGCDRKTDVPKPKTAIGEPTSPASSGRVDPKHAHLVKT